MKYLHYGLGILLTIVGLTMISADSQSGVFIGVLGGGALLAGGTLLNRAITNRPLFSNRKMTRNNHRLKDIRWAIMGIMCFVISLLIPFCGQRDYLNYNEAFGVLIPFGSAVFSILGIFFVRKYLLSFK